MMNMSTRNVVGYCPNCKQNVLLVKEAPIWPLMIFLLIFTGGIGLIIYGIVYYNNTPSRCIHCRSSITLAKASNVQSSNQIKNITGLGQESDTDVVNSGKENKVLHQNFCSFCGEPLLNKEAEFCAHCGTKV